jgi:hypothetical protein
LLISRTPLERVTIEHGEQIAERGLNLEVLPPFTFGEFYQMGQEQFGGQSAAARHFVKRLPGTLQHDGQSVARDLAQTDIPAPAVEVTPVLGHRAHQSLHNVGTNARVTAVAQHLTADLQVERQPVADFGVRRGFPH